MSKGVHAVICSVVVLISTTAVFVEGLPMLGPDLNTCQPVIPPTKTAAEAIDCCFVDTSRPIKDFKFNLDLPVRVRRPAHNLDDEFVRKYERAVELMKALPPEDPRSFDAQSRLHCSYGAGAYKELNSSEELDVHISWLVMPFHRWYVYFYERILASLIGDDTFAIPYWAWDVQNEYNPPANIIPSIFTNKNSSLYDEKRSKLHQPPVRVDLQFYNDERAAPKKDSDVLLQDNYYNLWRAMIGQARTPDAFYGRQRSEGDVRTWLDGGVLTSGPHSAVHRWTGDYDNPAGEDMSATYSAARDPIFLAHHSQIDRLWLMWKSWGGQDLDEADWFESEFLLYDEHADLVRVNVRDTLNFSNFRVTYEQVEPDWVNYTPKSIREVDPKYAQASILRQFWRHLVTGGTYRAIAMSVRRLFQKEKDGAEVPLERARSDILTLSVFRPDAFRSNDDWSVYDEVLVISGVVRKPFDISVLVHIFLELPEADENTPQHCAEFLGSVTVDAEGFRAGMDPSVSRKFTKSIGITDSLQILNIIRQKSVTVTFVPTWNPENDSITFDVTDLKVGMMRARDK